MLCRSDKDGFVGVLSLHVIIAYLLEKRLALNGILKSQTESSGDRIMVGDNKLTASNLKSWTSTRK